MSVSAEVRKEVDTLYREGTELAAKLTKAEVSLGDFRDIYNSWYTKAMRIVKMIAQDRLKEFQSYYEIDAKRKRMGFGAYSIQDYLMDLAPTYSQGFDPAQYTHTIFCNQLSILRSLMPLLESRIYSISSEILFEIIDDELRTATELLKISARAAGAVAGVVLEKHLQKVVIAHGIEIGKRNPTISDCSSPACLSTPCRARLPLFARN